MFLANIENIEAVSGLLSSLQLAAAAHSTLVSLATICSPLHCSALETNTQDKEMSSASRARAGKHNNVYRQIEIMGLSSTNMNSQQNLINQPDSV